MREAGRTGSEPAGHGGDPHRHPDREVRRGSCHAEGVSELAVETGKGVVVDILLLIAVVVIVLALLGFTGVVAALRAAAWLILVIGIVILVLAFIF